MEVQSVLTLIIAIMFFVFGLIILLTEINHKKILIFICLVISGFFMYLTADVEGYNRGQIDALKGKQKFKMQIHYHMDSLFNFVPIDTTFLIKEGEEEKFFFNSLIRPEYQEEYKRDVFIKSIIERETRNTNTINESENAVGYLQIRPILLRDINRIVGYKKYTLKDRWSKEKSIEMFMIYQNHYNPEWDLEKGARIWNGGPDGYLQDNTLTYWEDVKERMENHLS